MAAVSARIAKLVNHHRHLETELERLELRGRPTPRELVLAQRLKLRKLQAKDRISSLQRLA